MQGRVVGTLAQDAPMFVHVEDETKPSAHGANIMHKHCLGKFSECIVNFTQYIFVDILHSVFIHIAVIDTLALIQPSKWSHLS